MDSTDKCTTTAEMPTRLSPGPSLPAEGGFGSRSVKCAGMVVGSPALRKPSEADSGWSEGDTFSLSSPLSPFLRTEQRSRCHSSSSVCSDELPVDLGQLSPGYALGRGGNGTIYQLLSSADCFDDCFLAIKVPHQSTGIGQLLREAELLSSVPASEYVLSLFGVHRIGDCKGMVMERLEGKTLERLFGELQQQYQQHTMTHSDYWGCFQFLLRQAILGVVHLEKHGRIHADIKPSNFIFDVTSQRVKLIDFGSSVRIGEPVRPGHELFTSPEALEWMRSSTHTVSASSQMGSYSIGQMTYSFGETRDKNTVYFTAGAGIADIGRCERELLGFRLFRAFLQWGEQGGSSAIALCSSVSRSAPGLAGCRSQYVDFVNALLHIDPDKRMSLSEALEHPFLADPLADDVAAIKILDSLLDGLDTHASC